MGDNHEGSTNGGTAASRRLTLAEATRRLLGDNHGLRDPQRWVTNQLLAGRFRGQKIGRSWFMREVDIETALEAMNNVPTHRSLRDHPPPQHDPPVVPANAPDIWNGLSARARRRVSSSTTDDLLSPRARLLRRPT